MWSVATTLLKFVKVDIDVAFQILFWWKWTHDLVISTDFALEVKDHVVSDDDL
jgi:hypothetical protein